MTQHGTETYLKYYNVHPEDFRDEPVLGACGTVSVKRIESGESTAIDIDRSAEYRRKRWEEGCPCREAYLEVFKSKAN